VLGMKATYRWEKYYNYSYKSATNLKNKDKLRLVATTFIYFCVVHFISELVYPGWGKTSKRVIRSKVDLYDMVFDRCVDFDNGNLRFSLLSRYPSFHDKVRLPSALY